MATGLVTVDGNRMAAKRPDSWLCMNTASIQLAGFH